MTMQCEAATIRKQKLRFDWLALIRGNNKFPYP